MNKNDTVVLIIRKENGDQIGLECDAYSLAYRLLDINLYTNNHEEWLREFNLENHVKSLFSKFKIPYDYGIIAIDFIEKKIYSSQYYCPIGIIPFCMVLSRQELVKNYFDHGMLKEIEVSCIIPKAPYRKIEIINISSITINEIFEILNEVRQYHSCLFGFSNEIYEGKRYFQSNFLKNVENGGSTNPSFKINGKWSFITYHDKCPGVLKIKNELDKNGFIFSDEENQEWKKYVSHTAFFYYENKSEKEEFLKLYQDVFGEPFVEKNE